MEQFLNLIGNKNASPFFIGGENNGFDSLLKTVSQGGQKVIFGNGRKISNWLYFFKKNQPKINFKFYRFAILSGDFPKSGIAIPLDSRHTLKNALKHLFLYKGKSFLKKLKIDFLRIIYFDFLKDVFFKRQFLILIDSSKENPFSFLGSKLKQEDLTFSIYCGSRKFILPLFNKERGNFLGVAKAYFGGIDSFYGKNESKILKSLSKFNFEKFFTPPVLFSGKFNESFILMMSGAPHLKNFNFITKEHILFLKTLSLKTGSRISFSSSDFKKAIETEIIFLRGKLTDKFDLIQGFYDKAISNLQDREFTFALTKREFPFFEIMRSEDKFFVIDWEQARFGFPPIFDLFSLLMSQAKFKKGDYVSTYEKNIENLFFSKNKFVKSNMTSLLELWQITRDDAYWFFQLYLIDQLYIHLHVNHHPSAQRIISFLEKVSKNEASLKELWLRS